jgi:hypothetical protein
MAMPIRAKVTPRGTFYAWNHAPTGFGDIFLTFIKTVQYYIGRSRQSESQNPNGAPGI